MLEVKNIHKSYDDKEILKGIDLKVDKGDVIAIIGPSGSGKTTFLRCLNFLALAEEGTMVFDEYNIDFAKKVDRKQIADIRKRTGFVFQNYNLFANKTALENITEGLIIARNVDKKVANDKAMELLKKVGLQDRADRYPTQLSGGQQQRVAIARALATDPEIIYFDEPTSALDPELIGEVLEVMKQLAKENRTMMIVTHEMNFAKEVSNKTLFMDDGIIVEQGSSKQIFENPKMERTKMFLQLLEKEN